MKQLLKCSSFYQDISVLTELISKLEFEDVLYGQEIKDFSYIPEGLSEFINNVLQEDVEIQSDTGIFRKPSNLIHFDNFYQHTLWTCVVALEDTKINIHAHKDGHESFFDVKDNVNDFFMNEAFKPENWTITSSISLKKNEFLFIRPWIWRSYKQNKLVQTFLLNTKIGQ